MILFESTHVRNKEFYKEIYSYYHFKSKSAVILEVIVGMALLTSLLSLVFDTSVDYTIYGCILFIILVRLWSYRRTVKISMDREKEISSEGEITYTVAASEDKIFHKSSLGTYQTIDLSVIKKVYKTKNYIVLQSQAKQLYVFKKDAFTIGEEHTFLTFLRGKGYKI